MTSGGPLAHQRLMSISVEDCSLLHCYINYLNYYYVKVLKVFILAKIYDCFSSYHNQSKCWVSFLIAATLNAVRGQEDLSSMSSPDDLTFFCQNFRCQKLNAAITPFSANFITRGDGVKPPSSQEDPSYEAISISFTVHRTKQTCAVILWTLGIFKLLIWIELYNVGYL